MIEREPISQSDIESNNPIALLGQLGEMQRGSKMEMARLLGIDPIKKPKAKIVRESVAKKNPVYKVFYDLFIAVSDLIGEIPVLDRTNANLPDLARQVENLKLKYQEAKNQIGKK